VEEFGGAVQFGRPLVAAVLGLGQQSTAAVDGGGQAGGQGGLVALQAGPSWRAASPSCWEVAPRRRPSSIWASSARAR
jgi:hypothetical protein